MSLTRWVKRYMGPPEQVELEDACREMFGDNLWREIDDWLFPTDPEPICATCGRPQMFAEHYSTIAWTHNFKPIES